MRLLSLIVVLLNFALSFAVYADSIFGSSASTITRQDVLRGSITPERAWWDLSHYHLKVKVDPSEKTISGTNTVSYRVLSEQKRLQIELQAPMQLTKALQNGQALEVEKDGYSFFITLNEIQAVGSEHQVTLFFSGKPLVAKRAPWDGGITWTKDSNGIDFIASSNQGIGASIWWPNKDHAYDEPDLGAIISVEVPEHLVDVSNGRLIDIEHDKKAKTKTYHWQVKNPINNYGININIGDYVHFGEKYQGENGELDLDYWVLKENLAKAKVQFKEGKRTIEALEYWLGPYPFYQDSYKLVEAPYLGMEHQSSVTYGNGYKNGYLGRDLSGMGPGLLFDFIIVHETAHEWFANNITSIDIADMWIHEAFTNYAESLFLEYHFDKESAYKYIRGLRASIANDKPIIGQYNVHKGGSKDMYYKGSNMLHTIRQVIDDDVKWREILRGLNKAFYHKTVTTEQVETYISKLSGKDLSKIFDQYLRDFRIPMLEYVVIDQKMRVRWGNAIEGFNMPVRIYINGKAKWITPTTQWVNLKLSATNAAISVDPNFYISTLNITGD
ncbi:M1 family metallopeptidase [Thalassotalea piscium]|uniref:Aminopeptidase N n=1 Tax=Thalassotalea piscium TaxID=1230533 RepID=A0A7X0NEI3_9GAMM|nr:M1 family metallopeptidase [Thalassotalea piscium]MBB6541969.1 aminopeptidase N [Thalassotalea piscium]